MTRRRVAVTGLGCVTPAGNDVASTWQALLAGRSAVGRVKLFEDAGCRSQVGAEVRDFDAEGIGARQDMRRVARSSRFAMAAALEAWRDAGLDAARPDPARCGVILGTGVGDAAETFNNAKNYLERGVRGVHPLYVARVMPNAGAAHISLELNLRGPSFTAASACSAGGHAVGMAVRAIQHGEADVMLAGGTEEMSCILMQAAFDAVRALCSTRNDRPEKASRPFDRTRDGFVLGEGAGMVALEEWERAHRRGARILAELAGFGQASDAHHITAPEPSGEGAVLAIRAALADAGRRSDEVQYVNAHGTSTPLNDRMETVALKRVFGDHARRLAVSSTKSMLGHMIGASAAVALVATVLSLREGRMHPTINYEEPDPECDLDYVPNRAREGDLRLALVNSFGFGGHCISLAVARA